MTTRIATWLSWPSVIRTVVRRLRLATRLMREPEISVLLKALPILAGLYVVSPLDFIPDVLPVIGQVDDLGILLLALESFVKLAPSTIVTHHQSAIDARRPFSRMPHDGPIIEAEFRREN